MNTVAIYITHDVGVRPVYEAHFAYKMVMLKDGEESGGIEDFGKLLNAGEKETTLYAVVRALKRMNRAMKIDIYVPSIYIYSVVEKTTYLQKWKEKGYEYIKYADLWQQFTDYKDNMDIHLIYDNKHQYTEYLSGQIKERVKAGKL